ncbi:MULTISPECIES: septum formation initiator family protein [unclassified Microbacterium]|uniref:FtsB family cell division protein n=1 Tax=unclassified Microbacterium TaxID=2609290 RepID=UPI001D781D61|nr:MULTISPECIES: septum formation initiator family protein [unclassified Microbacterium]CAH0128206.1 Cell division protein FtsL [Microbacterium sp. Bi121]HWK77096.1 septum formation initiator family protein [Microbacterium sp.]
MARRPVPPSRVQAPSVAQAQRAQAERASRRPQVDVRDWASGIRLSGFMVIMLSLVILGAWVLVPTLGTYIDQRQKIAALEASVQVSAEQIEELEQVRERWDDPAYITTQARERLYYVKPGEVVYLVDNDLDPASLPQEQAPVSDELEETPADWMPQLLRSVAGAGLAQNATSAE